MSPWLTRSLPCRIIEPANETYICCHRSLLKAPVGRKDHGMQDPVHAANDTLHIFAHSFAGSRSEPGFAVLHAEHELAMQRKMRREHSAVSRAPTGAQPSDARVCGNSVRWFPVATLPSPPANFLRASGSKSSVQSKRVVPSTRSMRIIEGPSMTTPFKVHSTTADQWRGVVPTRSVSIGSGDGASSLSTNPFFEVSVRN
jgi:hypothetical protein